MNFANPTVFILFFAIVYLVGIYGLLTIAQINKPGSNGISQNPEKTSN